VPNFSEGKDLRLVAELGASRRVLDVHADPDHNRCVVTMAAASAQALIDELMAMVALAMKRIDITSHAGLHPRVGAADVVPIVPLAGSMAEAVDVAHRLGERVWREFGLPVFFYGEAAGGRRLAEIRRGRLLPDLGGPALHPTAGAVCVGSRPLLVAYNIVFSAMPPEKAARLVRRMRELPGIQALAFRLGDRLQLSMNLARLEEAGAATAFEAALRLSGQPGKPELVGLCPAAAAGPGCDGALLEARLASTAAHWSAQRAQRLGDEELRLLGRRLEREARSLRGLDASQESLLGGAERTLALLRMLRPAGIGEPESESFLRAAAAGFRQALRSTPGVRKRLTLVDRWLTDA
jgi:glutamate formiminotransferase / 5-formyltetrahydrofolate cyclo-ligase